MQEAPLMLKNKTARRIKDIPGFVFQMCISDRYRGGPSRKGCRG